MSNHRVDLDLAVHVPVDDFRNVGPATGAAKGGAAPAASGDKLERAGGDFLSGTGDADDDGFAPSLVRAFQRLAHHIRVADAFKGIVGAATGQLDQMADETVAMIGRVDEMGHAEALAPLFLVIVEVDADDHVRADHPQALDHIEADTAEAEDHSVAARFRLGGVDYRADAGGHAAADIADLVERRGRVDLGQRDLWKYGEIGECRSAHIVQDRLAVQREPAGAVRHYALALRGADRLAQVGLRMKAIFALATFRRVERNNMVARFQRGHISTDLKYDTRALMPKDGWKQPFWVRPRQSISVSMANAGGFDFHQYLTGFRSS